MGLWSHAHIAIGVSRTLEPEAKDVDPQSLRFKTEIHAPTAACSEKPPSRASPSFDRFWGRYWKTAACELPPSISVGTALAVGQERPGIGENSDISTLDCDVRCAPHNGHLPIAYPRLRGLPLRSIIMTSHSWGRSTRVSFVLLSCPVSSRNGSAARRLSVLTSPRSLSAASR